MLSDHERRAVRELETALLSDTAFARAVLPVARSLEDRAAPVVVGVRADGRSQDALDWAAAEAAGQRCPLRVVHGFCSPVVLDPFGVVPAAGCLSAEQSAAAEVVRAAIARARLIAPDIEASGYVVVGGPAQVLLRESRHARLLVLGAPAHRAPRGGLLRLPRGSLWHRVSSHAGCPVTVVHPVPEPGRASTPPRVVVGVDGTASSDDAVRFAFRSAQRRGVALTAVHAWSADCPADLEAITAPLVTTEAAAHALVERAVDRWRGRYPDVRVGVEVVRRDPASALITGSADGALVVLGSRRHRVAALFGSVSRAVVDGAAGPVAVVRRGAEPSPPGSYRWASR